jgi:hypothetical protein
MYLPRNRTRGGTPVPKREGSGAPSINGRTYLSASMKAAACAEAPASHAGRPCRRDILRFAKDGGRCRIRTCDFHRVKVTLYR